MIKPENYNPESYVMIMNDPTREYYKVYEIANYRNTYEGVNWIYLNLPNDVIKKAAISSIKGNEAMYASVDVAMYNSADGLPTEFVILKCSIIPHFSESSLTWTRKQESSQEKAVRLMQ